MKRLDPDSARARWASARHDERTFQGEVAAEVYGPEMAAKILAAARAELAELAARRGIR